MPQHVELIRQSVLCAREPTSTNVRGSCMAGSLMPCWVCVAKCTQQCAVIVTAPPTAAVPLPHCKCCGLHAVRLKAPVYPFAGCIQICNTFNKHVIKDLAVHMP